jgi:hypothetical protein
LNKVKIIWSTVEKHPPQSAPPGVTPTKSVC